MLVKKLHRTLTRFGMLQGGEGVVVAVSGGVDSMVLLHLLVHLRESLTLRLHVAHLDHGLRGEEGDRDARFVKEQAARLGLPATIERIPVQREKGSSLQETARKVRYQFLEQVAESVGAQKIALGHTQDDLAETFLMNLLRGSGRRGLAGIPPVREGRIIRPLIETSRQEILAYAEAYGIPSVTDSSNLKPRYLRNRIRLTLLPVLAQYNPKIVQILAHTALILQEEEAYLSHLTGEHLASVMVGPEGGEPAFHLPTLQRLPLALKRRVLREVFRSASGLSFSWEQMAALEELLAVPSSKLFPLPGGFMALRDGEVLRLVRQKGSEGSGGEAFPLPSEGEVVVPAFGLRFRLTPMPREACHVSEGGPSVAFLDAAVAKGPFTVRAWRPGDRFFPLGLRGSKKLQDFFVDAKIARWKRTCIPLLLSGDQIAWVVGFRIDERFKVADETREVLRIEALPLHGLPDGRGTGPDC